MREKKSDYFENSRRAVAIQREYAARNPYGFIGYEPNFWGITAGDGPTMVRMTLDATHPGEGQSLRKLIASALGVPRTITASPGGVMRISRRLAARPTRCW